MSVLQVVLIEAVLRARTEGSKQRHFALLPTKNQRQVRQPLYQLNRLINFKNCEIYGYGPAQILPHDSYLINLGHPEEVVKPLKNQEPLFSMSRMQRCER